MQLSVWTYEGPPHIGAMRVATGMRDVHYLLHAPQGDTYADLLFTMIERRGKRPPVTYTTFQARDLGKDTAELFQSAARDAVARFQPAAMLVGASCTAELIQDDPAGMAQAMRLDIPVIPLELPSYSRKENWGASETFYQIVRALAVGDSSRPAPCQAGSPRPKANLLGPSALGFRHRDDIVEVSKILGALGVEINVTAPLGASAADIARIGEADFNIVLYPEIADTAARWLERQFRQPFTKTIPIGHGATIDFIHEVARLAGVDPAPALDMAEARMPWWSRSVDSTYLTGKRVFIFGDATHAIAAARVARDELGFVVCGLGCYNREFARDLRAAAAEHGVEPLITDDHLEVEEAISAAHPELVLGTQMERHIAKRLSIPCAVISAPVHVQDFPARHSPQMGFEGANVLFDSWVHPLVMGLEEHLLTMFRDDFEFHDGAGASHLHASAPKAVPLPDQGGTRGGSEPQGEPATAAAANPPPTPPLAGRGAMEGELLERSLWTAEAEAELKKIPFFVRGKARRNTERFAEERGLTTISLETLYDAKAHYAR
ncbi:ferredoxin:protochlorophyllide reductase (ATP-dependent) subunit B [Sphingomonas ursincola]|uniref:Light-independent protochlorophyllide reductase subunit B n=1 Tax=Sphingomonas ursincola TaxID=56361 RepID=A0A7V8RGM1_9SPHN|nr:ferredoxin:protochlorophyllide reductase (ATP-dependent) subunit B [Sphingomonas ursincola]MBA1376078.1 ferredoxin:protochlorophyllide reductase (ATP-dependent) subunit B [Sphingomonas ursincola]